MHIVVRRIRLLKFLMAAITPRKRNRIPTLSEHCSYTQTAIANIVGVSQKSVSRIIKQQEATGSVTLRRK